MSKVAQDKQIDEAQNVKDARQDVATELSLLEKDSAIISDIQKEVLQEEIEELPPIKEGDINIHGIYAYDNGDKLEVKVYIRNGFEANISFDNMGFRILNSKGEVLAHQIFNLKPLGELSPKAARPLKLFFNKENVFVDKIPMDDWHVAFSNKIEIEQFVDVEYENLSDEIDDQDQQVYEKFLKEIPKLKAGEFTVSPFSLGITKEGKIIATVVMRNGSDRSLNVDKIPIILKDSKGTVVKSALFELDDVKVNPFKARICNFLFETGVKLEENISLNDWSISFSME